MPNEAWKVVYEDFGLSYRQRSVSHALIAICMFHDEKTPSFFAYPSGDYYCYGCNANGTIDDFNDELRDRFTADTADHDDWLLAWQALPDSEKFPPF